MQKLAKKLAITFNPELKSYTNSAGLNQIVIRITQDGKHSWEPTKLKVKPAEWNGITGKWVNSKNPDHKSLNFKLTKKITEFADIYEELEKKSGIVDKVQIINTINKAFAKNNFLSFWDQQVSEMKNYNQAKGYNTTRAKIVEYQGSETFDFPAINKQWLLAFEAYFIAKGDAPVYVYTMLRHVRRIWNIALDAQPPIVNKELYPFGRNQFSLKEVESESQPKRLDDEELRSWINLKYDKKSDTFFVQKGFLLSFYCAGMRIEDLLTLKWSKNIANGHLQYNMKKGVCKGHFKKFKIIPEMKKILDDLEEAKKHDGDYIFPWMTPGIESKTSKEYKQEVGRKTSLYNKYLKIIADDIGTGITVGSHVARHTWAGRTYELTKDIKFIQENLGHKDIKTTIAYVGKLTSKHNDEILQNIYAGLK